MAETNLITAKYFQERAEEEAGKEQLAAAQPQRMQVATGSPWERAAKRFSYVIAAAVAVCIVACAIPFFASAGSAKRTNPLDWWLRFGGARSDQTFEKFLRDTATASKHEWDERYRKSPAYQFSQQPLNLQFQPSQLQRAPGFKRK